MKIKRDCYNCRYFSKVKGDRCRRPNMDEFIHGIGESCGPDRIYWKAKKKKKRAVTKKQPAFLNIRTFTVSIADSFVEYKYPLNISGCNSIERIYRQLCLQMGAKPEPGKIRRRLYCAKG